MGYTHYWDILDAQRYAEHFDKLVEDTNLIIELADLPLHGWEEGATSIAKPDHGFGDGGNLVGKELGIGGISGSVLGEVKGDVRMAGSANEKECEGGVEAEEKKDTANHVELVSGEDLPPKSHASKNVKTSITATEPRSDLHGTPYASLEHGIFLNGQGSDGHETFILPVPKNLMDEDYSWRLGAGPGGFCKTARKPYDLVVCVVLMRARMLMGEEGFSFSSDGIWNFDKEWIAARQFYSQLWPEDELVAERMGMEEWSEEQIQEMESKYGPGVDERWVGAMFMKEVLGPVQAMFNAMMSGEGVSEEQLEWLKGPLPAMNPNRVLKEGEKEGEEQEEGPEGYVRWARD
ncbi:uncharacterized protein PAC_06801 [Phialocephala subalpina]|uniref:Uncharacterized protein n=1 Tax=Phialocephala subalpina TaxID=576137 RepID=A0A1L7WVY1_9HELO|nr:uncharacterized protein PAC_06801 [Phialocephala subalpina]